MTQPVDGVGRVLLGRGCEQAKNPRYGRRGKKGWEYFVSEASKKKKKCGLLGRWLLSQKDRVITHEKKWQKKNG